MRVCIRLAGAAWVLFLLNTDLQAQPAFDCVTLTAPNAAPDECLEPENAAWCPCLRSELTTLLGGQKAAIQQAQIYIVGQSTPGKIHLSVGGGTLDLTQVGVDDVIGQVLIDVPIQGESFLLDFAIKVTAEEFNKVNFEVRVSRTTEFSKGVLGYDPLDMAHSEGLTYEGVLESFGPGKGFEFSYHLVENPPGGLRGVSDGDLVDPGFNVPALLNLFLNDPPVPAIPPLYTLPPEGGLISIESLITHITDPLLEKSFVEEFRVEPSVVPEKFRRGDANGDGVWDISDAVGTLGALFLGEGELACPDAADANDDGLTDISDAVASLGGLFLGDPPPPSPGPQSCDVDPSADTLGKCVYGC